MKKYFLVGLLLFVGNVVFGVTNSGMNYPIKVVNGKSYYEYPVQKSEGFYSISKRFGVTEEEIKAVNPGTEKGLTFNSVILIPLKERNYIVHKVDKKETLYSLSKKYDVTYDDLYALNPKLKEEGLKYGTDIKIPERKTVTVQTMTVSDTVKKIKKETFFRLVLIKMFTRRGDSRIARKNIRNDNERFTNRPQEHTKR